MIRNGEMSMVEVKRILRRYWWVLPLTVIGGVSLALGSTAFLPKRFTSHTLVLVDEPTVSPDLVKPVVSEATNQRLASMQEQILSRSRLQPIIEKFGLYSAERSTVHMEDLVARLRATIEVTPLAPMQGTEKRQLPGFHVNVTFDNPQIAQRICSEITTMFMEQNSRDIDAQGTQTTEFFAQQVDQAKLNLDEQDAKLADFKKKNMGSLPDQEQANLGLLTGMNGQLDAITQAVNRAQQDKVMNESLLSSQLATWKVVKGGDTPSETLDQQFKELTRDYQSAVDFYNDLLKRHDQAKIGRDLNRQQEGEQFRVLDAPSLPMTPSFPKKTLFAGTGLGGGLALGLAILYLLAFLDSSIHTERDVELCMKLPVLAMVPTVSPAGRMPTKSTDKALELSQTRA